MSKCDDGRFPHLSDVTFDVLSHCLEKFTGCHARTHRPTNCQAITIHVPGRRRPAILNMHYTRNFTHHSISTGRMLFLMPNKQCQSTKASVVECWCGYVSEAKCRLFAYGPVDATVIPKPQHLLPHLNPDLFTFLVPAYPGCPGNEAVKQVQ